MAKFYQQVKTLLSDIEKFLTQAVKDQKLNKTALTQKTSILAQITSLKEEWPQLQDLGGGAPENPVSNNTPAAEDEDEDNIYEDTDSYRNEPKKGAPSDEDPCKKEIAANDTSDVTHQGQLKLKKDKKGGVLSKLARKQHLVLRGKLLYIYEKKTSKKQTECFNVDGYQIQVDEEAKKDLGFEMNADGKKTYFFETGNAEELKTWVDILRRAAGTVRGPTPGSPVEEDPEDYYADGDGDRISDTLYEDSEPLESQAIPTADDSPPPIPKAHPKAGKPLPVAGGRPPPRLPGQDEPEDDPEAIYEDGESPKASPRSGSAQSSATPSGESLPKLPARPPMMSTEDDNQENIYDDTAPPEETPQPEEDDPKDIYDETAPPEPESPPKSPKKNQSSLFSESHQKLSFRLDGNARPSVKKREQTDPPPPPKKALPSVPKDKALANPADPDYANMYYGVWDCDGGHPKELSFKRGDMITVLSRKYEDKGWWVGRLNEKTGLVPRGYLSEAYERA